MIARRPTSVNSANATERAQRVELAATQGAKHDRFGSSRDAGHPRVACGTVDPSGLQVVDIRGYVKTEDLGEGRQHAEYVGARDEYELGIFRARSLSTGRLTSSIRTTRSRRRLAPADRFAEAMSRRGIGDETDVVVVDHTGGHFATRLWWALKYYGHDRVAVLDGGFNRWKAWLPLTDTVPEMERRASPPGSDQRFASRRRICWRRIGERSSSSSMRGTRPVHGGDSARERGAVMCRPRSTSGRSRSSTTMARGSRTTSCARCSRRVACGQTAVIAYCNGGVTATAVLFALDRIGHESWANYDGSWNEWGERRSCRSWKARNRLSGQRATGWTARSQLGGAKGRTRTADRTIFSRELYQLSYLGAGRGPAPVGDRGLEPLTSTV